MARQTDPTHPTGGHAADCWELACEDATSREQVLTDLAVGNTPCCCDDE